MSSTQDTDAPTDATTAEAPISLNLRLGVQIGAAFERQRRTLGITQRRVYALAILAGEIIDRENPQPQYVDAA